MINPQYLDAVYHHRFYDTKKVNHHHHHQLTFITIKGDNHYSTEYSKLSESHLYHTIYIILKIKQQQQ